MRIRTLLVAVLAAGANYALAADSRAADESPCPYYAVDIAAFHTCGAFGEGESAPPPTLDEPLLPVSRRTILGQYTDAAGAHRLRTSGAAHVLLVDLRSESELASAGGPEPTDLRVAWPREAAEPAAIAGFVAAIERELVARGLDRDTHLLLICASGRRSTAATDALARAGYTRVTNVIDGYEGDQSLGLLGWRQAGLPRSVAPGR
jgi:rhodanese-related sulfurtransferase